MLLSMESNCVNSVCWCICPDEADEVTMLAGNMLYTYTAVLGSLLLWAQNRKSLQSFASCQVKNRGWIAGPYITLHPCINGIGYVASNDMRK
jgi:hypothetical protein